MPDLNIVSIGTDALQAELQEDKTVVCDVTDSPILSFNRMHHDVTTGVVPDDVTPTAIFLHNNVDSRPASSPSDFTPDYGKSNISPILEFISPTFGDTPAISVFDVCIAGTCDCRHSIGGVPAQLKPCRAASFIFGPNSLPTISEEDRQFIWQGLVNGFKIVDPDCPATYSCQNYESIISDKFKDEMTTLLQAELATGKVSRAAVSPTCIHALGAVKKSDGRLRPITDCSRPDGHSINNFMSSTFKSFSYNSVDTAVQVLNPADFMSVVDISSAYRSVNVHADHTKLSKLELASHCG